MAQEITVLIPTPLREYTDGASEVTAEGETVNDILKNLNDRFDGLEDRIYDDDGEMQDFINVYYNDEDIRHLEGLETSIEDGAELSLIPAVAGGR
jgi:molybdopterin converting factor small subunit